MNSRFMLEALKEARLAKEEGEVPVGAVIVRNGRVIARGRNHVEREHSALCHAEMEAIANACREGKDRSLTDCELYVTLEPCPMCTGAILNARVGTLVFGAYDPKAGCIDSVVNLCGYPFNHHPEIYGGIREEECGELLSSFFEGLRHEKPDR